MRVILDIKDEKAHFVLELLFNLKYVKVKPQAAEDDSPSKQQILDGIRVAV